MPYSEAKRIAKEKLIGVKKTYAAVAAKSINTNNIQNSVETNKGKIKIIDQNKQKVQQPSKQQQPQQLGKPEPCQKQTSMIPSQLYKHNTIDISNKGNNRKSRVETTKETTPQTSKSICTILSDHTHYPSTGAPERKRDHSELAGDHAAERATKKSVNNTSVVSHLTHPSSSIVTVPRDKESSRECKGPKMNVSCAPQPTKTETNYQLI